LKPQVTPSLVPVIQLTPVTEHEFLVVRELAETVWRQHDTGNIPGEQIDSMLAGRFSDDALRGQLQPSDKWLELLREAVFDIGAGFVMDGYVMAKGA
jgi:hypothetical protein